MSSASDPQGEEDVGAFEDDLLGAGEVPLLEPDRAELQPRERGLVAQAGFLEALPHLS